MNTAHREQKKQRADLDSLRTAIVKITAYCSAFDWQQPYNKNLAGSGGTGTGFVLKEVQRGDDEVLIVTAYHVVDMGQRLLVDLSDAHHTGGPIQAKLILYSQSLDVAVISIPLKMPSWMHPLHMARSDSLQPNDQIQAVGFPLRKGFQMTFGNVSGRGSDRVQIDAAINRGNSGGPLILAEKHLVIGIVVSGYDAQHAQNMNYATPIEECRLSLFAHIARTHKEVVVSTPELSLNIDLVKINPDLKETFDGCGEGGAYVSFVLKDSELYRVGVRKGDLICKVDDQQVDIRGNIRFKWWPFEALPAVSALYRKKEGDSVNITYWSAQNGMNDVAISAERDKFVFRAYDPESEEIPFSIHGGVVVQMMTKNLMEAREDLKLRYGFVFKQPQLRAYSLPTVTYLIPTSPFTTMGVLHEGDVIVQVNDTRVSSLAEYDEAFAKAEKTEKVVILHTYFGDIACATPASIQEIKEEVHDLIHS